MRCVTHHLACDCRETEFAALRGNIREHMAYGAGLRGATTEYHLRRRIEELEKEVERLKENLEGVQ